MAYSNTYYLQIVQEAMNEQQMSDHGNDSDSICSGKSADDKALVYRQTLLLSATLIDNILQINTTSNTCVSVQVQCDTIEKQSVGI